MPKQTAQWNRRLPVETVEHIRELAKKWDRPETYVVSRCVLMVALKESVENKPLPQIDPADYYQIPAGLKYTVDDCQNFGVIGEGDGSIPKLDPAGASAVETDLTKRTHTIEVAPPRIAEAQKLRNTARPPLLKPSEKKK